MSLKIFIAILFVILEIPLFIKAQKAYKNIDIIRFTAILILMFLTAFLVYGIYIFLHN